jgi:hypothetical protein
MLYLMHIIWGRKATASSREHMAVVLPEKRQFPRIKLHSPLHYEIRGGPEFNSAVGDNISLGGMGFSDNRFISPETLIMLKINILSRILSPIGKIAWSAPIPHSDRYRSGIEFLELDPIEKNYLRDYLDMQMGRL